jgi:hypothetical protein
VSGKRAHIPVVLLKPIINVFLSFSDACERQKVHLQMTDKEIETLHFDMTVVRPLLVHGGPDHHRHNAVIEMARTAGITKEELDEMERV